MASLDGFVIDEHFGMGFSGTWHELASWHPEVAPQGMASLHQRIQRGGVFRVPDRRDWGSSVWIEIDCDAPELPESPQNQSNSTAVDSTADTLALPSGIEAAVQILADAMPKTIPEPAPTFTVEPPDSSKPVN